MVSLASSLQRKEPVDVLRVTGDLRPQYLRLAVLDEPAPNAWAVNPIALGNDTLPANTVLPAPDGLDGEVHTTPSLDDDRPRPTSSRRTARGCPCPSTCAPSTSAATGRTSRSRRSSPPTTTSRRVPAERTTSLLDRRTRRRTARGSRSPADGHRERTAKSRPDVPQRHRRGPAGPITAGASNHYDQAVLLQAVLPATRPVHLRPRRRVRLRLPGDGEVPRRAARLLPALRRNDGDDGARRWASRPGWWSASSSPSALDGDDWVFTSHNVHAWPELYFEGVGWVRFEPTPRCRRSDSRSTPRTRSSRRTRRPWPPRQRADEHRPRTQRTERQDDRRRGAAPAAGRRRLGACRHAGGWRHRWSLVLALLPAVTRLCVRRRRMTRPVEDGEAAEAAWLELRDRIIDLRLPWTGSMTPRARERAIEPMLEGDVDGSRRLRRLTRDGRAGALCHVSSCRARTPAEDAREVMAVIARDQPSRSARARRGCGRRRCMPDLRAAGADGRRNRPRPVDAIRRADAARSSRTGSRRQSDPQ